jgi:hypothetical protein
MARMRPVPGSTMEAAVATRSSLRTCRSTDASTDFCAFGSSVVRIVSPPRFQRLARALGLSPNSLLFRKTSRT